MLDLCFYTAGFYSAKMEIGRVGLSSQVHQNKIALRTLSSAVRASMAHFNAVLKINFFFNTCTQPENLKLRRINAFITRRTKLPPPLRIIGEYDDT